jgi:hypothetical protein
MILSLFAGLLLYFWFLAQKAWGEKFIGYLKWSSLLFILILIAFDAFMMLQTQQFFEARKIGGDNGLAYSYFNNNTNLTVQTTMFAKQDDDSGEVMAYHKVEFAVMSIFAQYQTYIILFITLAMVIQFGWIVYKNGIGEGDSSREV